MRGDTPRNGALGDAGQARPEAVTDVFDLLRRRALAVVGGFVADGTMPAGLDVGGLTAVPSRPGAPGDVLVAGPVRGRRAPVGAARVVPALAEGLRAAPEVEAVAVIPGDVLMVTLRPATLFAAVRAVLQCPEGAIAGPGAAAEGGSSARSGPATLAEARAEAEFGIRSALSTASGRATPRLVPEAAEPRSSAPVFVRGRVPPDGDVLAWIGRDAFRFAVAACRRGSALHLDLDVLGDRTRADPSFWVRYAHARARGLLRAAAAASPGVDLQPAALAAADFARLSGEGDRRLAWLVACHAHTVASASPQAFAAHLVRVAEGVHSQWYTSKQQPQSPFVNEELREMAEARLGLVTAAALVLRSGLGIIGIAASDEMP